MSLIVPHINTSIISKVLLSHPKVHSSLPIRALPTKGKTNKICNNSDIQNENNTICGLKKLMNVVCENNFPSEASDL
jgi:hypothetical protein